MADDVDGIDIRLVGQVVGDLAQAVAGGIQDDDLGRRMNPIQQDIDGLNVRVDEHHFAPVGRGCCGLQSGSQGVGGGVYRRVVGLLVGNLLRGGVDRGISAGRNPGGIEHETRFQR